MFKIVNSKKYEEEIRNYKNEIISLNEKVSELLSELAYFKSKDEDINSLKKVIKKLDKEIFTLKLEKNNLRQLKNMMYARILELEAYALEKDEAKKEDKKEDKPKTKKKKDK